MTNTRESRLVGDQPAPEQTPTKLTSSPGMIAIPLAEYEQLRIAAESWWRWWAGDYLDDLVDQRFIAMSHAISCGVRWSGIGPRHQELARLRERPAWVCPCRRFGCKRQQTVYSPEEWRAGWRCVDHVVVAA